MNTRLLRSLPAAILLVLFAFTLGSSNRAARHLPPAEPESSALAPLRSSRATGAIADYSLALGRGVVQPLPALEYNLSNSIISCDPFFNCSKRGRLVAWDPVALVPDPTTVALRTVTSWATYLTETAIRYDWTPPVVLQCVPGVADPPRNTLAIDYQLHDWGNGQVLKYEPEGSPSHPAMREYLIGDPAQPGPGQHPVLSYTLGLGDVALQSRRVVQGVSRTDVELGVERWELAQKFQLPVAAQLNWIEFAIGDVIESALWPYENAQLRIYDAEGQAAPPEVWGTPIAATTMFAYPYLTEAGTGTWVSHYAFPALPVLEANHDYWIWIDSHRDHSFYGRFLYGDEPPLFDQRIGALYVKNLVDDPWLPLERRALSFKIIGTPTGTVSVTPPAPSRAAFALSVSPNPSRGIAHVRWSGAAGTAWFEVLDARGRRVATGEGASGGHGRWDWRGTDDGGRALPAGVYFLRATDDAGRSATERVVLVR